MGLKVVGRVFNQPGLCPDVDVFLYWLNAIMNKQLLLIFYLDWFE